MLSTAFAIFLYFLPSFIAIIRHHSSAFAIILVNVFFGWTMIGWFWALIWSATNPNKGNTVFVSVNQK